MIFVKERFGRVTDPMFEKALKVIYRKFTPNSKLESSLAIILGFSDNLMHSKQFIVSKQFKDFTKEYNKQISKLEKDLRYQFRKAKDLNLKRLLQFDFNNIALPDKIKFYACSLTMAQQLNKGNKQLTNLITKIIEGAKEMRNLITAYQSKMKECLENEEVLSESFKDVIVKLGQGLAKLVMFVFKPILKILFFIFKILFKIVNPIIQMFNRIIVSFGLDHLPKMLDVGASLAMSWGFSFAALPMIGISQSIGVITKAAAVAEGIDMAISGHDLIKNLGLLDF